MAVTVNEIMRFFFQYFTSVIPVMGDNGLIKGVLSKSIMVKLLGQRIDLDDLLREQIGEALVSFGSQEFERYVNNLLSDPKATFVPVIDEDGNLVDIVHKTDLFSLSESGMVISREKLSRMISISPLGVLSFSPVGVITYTNRAAEEMLGFNLVGKKLYELFDTDRFSLEESNGEIVFTQNGRLVRVYGDRFSHGEFFLGGFVFVEDISEQLFTKRALEMLATIQNISALCGLLSDGSVVFESFSLFLNGEERDVPDYKRLFNKYPEICSLIEDTLEAGSEIKKKVVLQNKRVELWLKPVECMGHLVGLLVVAVYSQDDYWGSSLRNMVRNTEKKMIERALEETNYNVSEAARLLGIPRQTLQYRLKVLGLNGNGSGEDA